jgi:uncharacterized membrane protein YcaP (DUF421 family)
VIISKGRLRKTQLAREGVTMDQVMSAIREHGLTCMQDIRLGVVEVDGSITIVGY